MIGYLVAGFVVGALARVVRRGSQNLDLPATIGVGIIGSLTGGAVARAVGGGSVFELDAIGFVLAVGVAVLFIGVADGLANARTARS
jgi:uncharacterized membrane protein YeaQ/YmgE (transglycosylase-associated protein family)